jgi:hypothetical protein
MSDSHDQNHRTAVTVAVIGGIFTLLAALIGLGAPLIARPGNPATTDSSSLSQSANQPVPTADLVSLNKPGLMAAVRLLGDIQAQAQYDLDPEPFSAVFSGEALKFYQADVENLRKRQVFAVAVRRSLAFDSFKLNSTGALAEVHATPVWEATLYSIATRQCVAYFPPVAWPQTLYLERTANGWLTYSLVMDNPELASPQPCP